MKYKVCNKCHKILLVNADNFHRNKDGKDGFRNTCKKCYCVARKKYYEANKDRINERNRVYKENNKEREKAYHRIYSSTTKGKLVLFNSRSRRRFKNYIHDITVGMHEDMINYFDGKCAYTGLPLDDTNFSFDHVIPNHLDGVHAIYNLVPCHRSINNSKHDKELLEWYPSSKHFSEERLKKIFEWLEYAYDKYN